MDICIQSSIYTDIYKFAYDAQFRNIRTEDSI